MSRLTLDLEHELLVNNDSQSGSGGSASDGPPEEAAAPTGGSTTEGEAAEGSTNEGQTTEAAEADTTDSAGPTSRDVRARSESGDTLPSSKRARTARSLSYFIP